MVTNCIPTSTGNVFYQTAQQSLTEAMNQNWLHVRHLENERLWFTNVYAVVVAGAITFLRQFSTSRLSHRSNVSAHILLTRIDSHHAVGIARGVLVALGCKVCGQCSKDECYWGIATQNPELRKNLNVDEGSQRVANYINAVTGELKTLTMLAGKSDVHKLTKEDLRALTIDASAITGVKLVGLEESFTP